MCRAASIAGLACYSCTGMELCVLALPCVQILMHSQHLPAHVAIDLQTWRKDLQGNMAKQVTTAQFPALAAFAS